MSRTAALTLAAVATFAVAGLEQQVTAQTIAYDHRSTVLGDHLAGASELVRAQGAFLKDEATAAETWTRVTAAQDQIQYQRTTYRSDVARMETENLERKAQTNRERQQAEANADMAAALRLYQSVQRGAGFWPVALRDGKYASSLATISALMRNWSPQDSSSEVYRVALATEIGVLRNRVAADRQLDFASRVDAVKTLKQLQQLATMPATELPSQWQERQLAMK
ncbi:MAG: hypothetical protein C0485_12185 [Pirellula sp.]|nr:hypothetical protein [Pirellula sp.]